MSQHNIIGSEAFSGRTFIMVRHIRSGIGRRRRRPALMLAIVAVIALLAGAAVAALLLGPLLVEPAPAQATELAGAPMRDQMRMQPVPTAAEGAAATGTIGSAQAQGAPVAP